MKESKKIKKSKNWEHVNIQAPKEHPYRGFFMTILASIISSLTVYMVTGGFSSWRNRTTDVATIKADQQMIKNEFQKLGDAEANDKENTDNEIKSINKTLIDLKHSTDDINKRLDRIDLNQMNSAFTVKPSKQLASSLALKSSSDFHGGTIGTIQAESKDTAALSLDGKNEFSFRDLVSKKMVIPYNVGNEEVFFCGQYNDQLHWDGNCVLNVYKDGKLSFITEANYVDGTVVSYLQVFSSENDSEWIISRRNADEEGYYGITVKYDKKNDFKQQFETSRVSGTDLYLADEFADKYISRSGLEKMNSYYKGYTSGGLYNDHTGDAYLITMDDEGDVLTLYHGGFTDGNFNDDSGDAWEITRKTKKPADQDDMKYMYFHGKVRDGKFESGKDNKNNLSQQEIDDIIEDYTFDIETSWH